MMQMRQRDRSQAQPRKRLRTRSGKQFSERQLGGSSCDSENLVALRNCAGLVRQAVQQTLTGDQEWAILLGEMIPWLTKRLKELAKNEAFSARFAEIKSSQRARKRGQTLRREIEGILREARLKHARLRFAEELGDPELCKAFARFNGSDLSELPEFNSSSADQWFETVVWPELKRREPELRNNPLIGDLKKANRTKGKRSGKFQLSDLKDQSRKSVRTLANAPRVYYFSDEIEST